MFQNIQIRHSVSDKLTWTHYRTLLGIKDDTARMFYIKEAIENNWVKRNSTNKIRKTLI